MQIFFSFLHLGNIIPVVCCYSPSSNNKIAGRYPQNTFQ